MRILIGVDASPHSERAVRFVTRMRWPAGSRVIVASVMTPPLSPPVAGVDAGVSLMVEVSAEQVQRYFRPLPRECEFDLS